LIDNFCVFVFLNRPTIKGTTYKEERKIIYSQSQNSSAKIALVVDETEARNYDNHYKGRDKWNRLDGSFFTLHMAILIQHSSFYFRMLKNVVDKLWFIC